MYWLWFMVTPCMMLKPFRLVLECTQLVNVQVTIFSGFYVINFSFHFLIASYGSVMCIDSVWNPGTAATVQVLTMGLSIISPYLTAFRVFIG